MDRKTEYPISSVDGLGINHIFDNPPRRIICLVPSLTELLCDLGLEDEIIGVTKFCVHPSHLRKAKELIGGTKNLRIEKILQLKPDLILANREENDKEQVLSLSKILPVYTTVIKDLEDSTICIKELGKIFNRESKALNIIAENQKTLRRLKNTTTKRAAYLIWRKPWMTIGGDTYIHHMMAELGYDNVFGSQERYPTLELSDLATMNIDMVMLSSEPYPFKDEHILEIKKTLPDVDVRLVDGELYSWYGSRLSNLTIS